MTAAEKAAARALFWRRLRRSALLGIVLALACEALPPDYRAPCRAIANVCTGVAP